MFLLSIVPIHLSTDSDRVAVNNANSTDVAEHRVMQLEALYSALIMRQYLGREITGISNLFMDGVKNELIKARSAELDLMGTTNTMADNNSFARLNEVTQMQQLVNQRVTDLQALKDAVSGGSQLNYAVTGVDNSNLASVEKELGYALQYKTELELSWQFWTQITQSHLTLLQNQNGNNNSIPDNTNTGTAGSTTTGTTGSTTTNNTNNNQSNNNSAPWALKPEVMASIAASKRKISDWQSLLSSLDSGQTIEQVTLAQDKIKQQISIEIYKARTQYNNHPIFTQDNNPSMQKFMELNGQLKTLINVKSHLEMLDGVEAEVTNEMSKEITNAQFYS